jgi:hypothetical protein
MIFSLTAVEFVRFVNKNCFNFIWMLQQNDELIRLQWFLYVFNRSIAAKNRFSVEIFSFILLWLTSTSTIFPFDLRQSSKRSFRVLSILFSSLNLNPKAKQKSSSEMGELRLNRKYLDFPISTSTEQSSFVINNAGDVTFMLFIICCHFLNRHFQNNSL